MKILGLIIRGKVKFVLGGADAGSEDGDTQAHGAQGDMPRGTQFGYVFSDRANDLGWLLAHELGHGVFTLKHLNESNYAGKSSLGTLPNLMDYTGSTLLAAFQWNVMSNPAILTGLDSDDASKGGETDRLSLSFDGKFLKLRVVEKGEILRFSYSAVSGRPHDNGSFDYSKERQKIKSEGPLPEGEYCINPQEITYADDREFWDKIKGYFGRGTFPGSPDILGNNAWGIGRIWILPRKIIIDGVERDNFSIHGGSESGSAGCIDLTDNDKDFFEKIEKYRLKDNKIKLIVKY